MSRFSQRSQSQPARAAVHVQAVEHTYLALQRTQRGLLGMLLVCAVLGVTVLRAPASAALGNRIYLPVILATSALTFAYTMRNGMVLPALAELRRDPRNPKLLKRWSRNNLIVQSLCAVVGLTGFGMQLFGAAPSLALTLYVISVAYLLLLRPARP